MTIMIITIRIMIIIINVMIKIIIIFNNDKINSQTQKIYVKGSECIW